MSTEDPPEADLPDDRAEDAMLDRLDAGLPAVSPEEQAARAPYERLRERLKQEPERDVPAGMRDRIRAAWQAERAARRASEQRRRRTRVVAIVGIALAAAAVVVLLAVRRGASPPSPIELVSLEGDIVRGSADVEQARPLRDGDTVAVDHVVRARGRSGTGHVELRIYRDRELAWRCPADPRCTGDGLQLTLVLDRPGTYHVVWMSSRGIIPSPGGGYEADLGAARAAGVRIARTSIRAVR